MPIYICTHGKNISELRDFGYKLIFGGSVNVENVPDYYIKDNTGYNISNLNSFYSEFTALYWIWKNTEDDKVGLIHYRRFFVDEDSNVNYNGNNIADPERLLKSLDSVDLIIRKPNLLHTKLFPYDSSSISIQDQYQLSHYSFDLFTTRETVKELYPDYIEAFDYVMESKVFYACNMFVMKREYFDEYMEWLFNIINFVSDRLDISAYDPYQQRCISFIGERLFNVWICKNNYRLKIRYCDYLNTEVKEDSSFYIERDLFRSNRKKDKKRKKNLIQFRLLTVTLLILILLKEFF